MLKTVSTDYLIALELLIAIDLCFLGAENFTFGRLEAMSIITGSGQMLFQSPRVTDNYN